MADEAGKRDDTVVIKKYANRRLYNTRSSSYITLDHLAKMTREGVDYKVIDAKTGADITHQILTQIILDEEANGEQMLPVNFLRDLIRMYGNSMQSLHLTKDDLIDGVAQVRAGYVELMRLQKLGYAYLRP